jgi:SAM-dependent methyltransferase
VDSNDVRRQWAERTGEYSPAYYAYYGPNETSETLRNSLERFIDRRAPVLELGCSAGRHLSHLHEHGFDDLAGIEVNDEAFDVMEATYPDLRAAGTFYPNAIEDVVGGFDDNQFSAVYSVETLQHLHPDSEWVFGELSRITDDLLITVENEGGHRTTQSDGSDVNYVKDGVPLYYRDWNAIFTERGFVELDVQSRRRDTMRTFRTARSSESR